MSGILTVMTPFGPGRPDVEERYQEAVANLQAPAGRTKFLLVDNTGKQPSFVDQLEEILQGKGYRVHRLTYEQKPAAITSRHIENHIVDLWCLMLPRVEGDYVLSLEHDVVPPVNAYARMREFLEEHPKAGAVALLLRSRRGGYSMAYPLVSLWPFKVGRVNGGPCTIDAQKLERAGEVHTGCTLMHSAAVKTISVEEMAHKHLHHQHFVNRAIQQAGWEIWLDGRLPRAKHYVTQERFF